MHRLHYLRSRAGCRVSMELGNGKTTETTTSFRL